MIFIQLILMIGSLIIAFFIGAVWMQCKETIFGKKANYICDDCDAIGCQFKFCELKRKEIYNR